MKTDLPTCDARQTSAPEGLGARIRAAFSHPLSPWVVAPIVLVFLWLLEAAVHLSFYPGTAFVDQLFNANAHESWMRFWVAVMLITTAAASSAGIRERARRENEHRLHEAALAEAVGRAAQGESESRRRISDRLHEGVSQELAAARMFLAAAPAQAVDEASAEAIASAQRIIDRAIAELRDIAQELSPPILDEYGLTPALEVIARRVSRSTGKPVRIKTGSAGLVALKRETLMAGFHVITGFIEEAAGAEESTLVDVDVFSDSGQVTVTVAWDARTRPDLLSACARVTHVGGSIRAGATPSGVAVLVKLPLAA